MCLLILLFPNSLQPPLFQEEPGLFPPSLPSPFLSLFSLPLSLLPPPSFFFSFPSFPSEDRSQVSHMLTKCSTTEQHLQSFWLTFSFEEGTCQVAQTGLELSL